MVVAVAVGDGEFRKNIRERREAWKKPTTLTNTTQFLSLLFLLRELGSLVFCHTHINSNSSRIRLFLYPTKPDSTDSIPPILVHNNRHVLPHQLRRDCLWFRLRQVSHSDNVAWDSGGTMPYIILFS